MPSLQSIDGRYRTLRVLGEGLTGEVFLVESDEGRFALKLLKPFADHDLDTQLIQAFKFEFSFLKDLRHPHVVRIADFGFDEKLRRFYFTEEFLQGQPIQDYARDASPKEISDLFFQAIQGLQAIHGARLLHGDIKGNNLLVVEKDAAPCVKLIDLGLSDPRFSASGGTPATMAPEKILKEPADERSDLYALGVVFYQLFSGINPFAQKSLAETYEAHLTLKPPKLSLQNPRVPAYWNEIFETLLAKNPASRYRNASELLAAIDFSRPEKGREARLRPWRLERWVGREALLDGLIKKIHRALKSEAERKAFILLGEPGVGKTRIAQELKYRFQMEKVRAAAPPRGDCDLWIAEGSSIIERPEEVGTGPRVMVLTADSQDRDDLEKLLTSNAWALSWVTVPCFSKEELEGFFRELSGLDKVPKNFLQGLWNRSHGNPQLVVALLEGFARQQRWVDAHGRWNLAAFEEVDLDFDIVAQGLDEVDALLAAMPNSDHIGKTELWLRRAEELLKAKCGEEACQALASAEEEARQVGDLAHKLRLRAAIYERRALQKINAHCYEEARVCVERALALLEEDDGAGEAQIIRANNYLAWLLCQEGKLDAAIDLFEEMQRRWESLPFNEQCKVLNLDLGSAYLMKGDAARAVAALQGMLPFFEKLGEPTALMRVHYNLGEAHLLAKDFSAAIASFQRGSELMRWHRNFDFLLRSYNGLGKARHLLGELKSALADYGRGLELADYLEDYPSAAALAQNIGSILAEQRDFAAAREKFVLALKLLGKLPEKKAYERYLEARALVELGDLFRRESRFQEAELHARDADRMATQDEALSGFRFWTLLTRAEIARDEGDRVRLQDILAELLPLADDEEKQARCAGLQEGKMKDPREIIKKSVSDDNRGQSTRVEKFDPEDSLLAAERRIGEERDPEALRRLIRDLQARLDRSEQELAQAREAAVESSVLRRFAEMDFLSRNKEMQELFRMVERVRDTDLSVVLHGESGTGKELLARSLHERSRRQGGPFVALNCAALPSNLVEAELFGYKAGSFTGATRDKAGLIEAAEGGTLFLDEIAELELPLQAKLLRVLQEKELTRLGETRPRSVKFRLLSASHRNLHERVQAGQFREDLYYRVAELELRLPPLRERKEDIPLLAENFIRRFLEEHGDSLKVTVGRELMKDLLDYDWPGNVRELENLIRVATALRRGKVLQIQDLPASWQEKLRQSKPKLRTIAPLPSASVEKPSNPESPYLSGKTWREIETLILAKALGHFGMDVKLASSSLKCAPSKLYQRLREDRIAERHAEWEAQPWKYREGDSLDSLKRRVFAEALQQNGDSPYAAARQLAVSAGTIYQWK